MNTDQTYLIRLYFALYGGHVNRLRYDFVIVGVIFLWRKSNKYINETSTFKLQT